MSRSLESIFALQVKPSGVYGPILAALLAVLAAACAGNAPAEDFVGSVSEAFITPRVEYDTSLSWEEMVKAHFFSKSNDGEFLPSQGQPDQLLIRDGKVKIKLKQDGQTQYLDPLALGSERLGEHPVHKLFRLKAMGISVDRELEEALEAPGSVDRLFHTLDFEYLKGQRARGTVAEVYPDGTFLVIPFDPPEAWRSDRTEVASPTHLHVNSRALSVADSQLAQDYETKILSLSFDKQRYPPADVARQQCGVYRESLANLAYREILDSVGYRFTPDQVVSEKEQDPAVHFGERLRSLLTEGAGQGVNYFGFEGSWVADRLVDLQAPVQVSWLEDCDTAGGIRIFSAPGESGKNYYLHVRRSLEPDKRQRYKIVKLENDGSGRVIYDAPGIMLMAVPLPGDGSRWIMSTEGWQKAGAGIPADPRWQAVYIVNINDPDKYEKVEFPIHQYPRAPEAGLYGSSARISEDQQFLFNTLYGFRDEGGGVWVTDLSADNFHQQPEAFKRIVDWDHALSWTLLDPEPEEGAADGTGKGAGPLHLFLTGKEVADNFAMTANVLKISGGGLNSAIQSQQRLLQMVGWNPVPYAMQKLPNRQFLVAVETHFDYESSLLPRAKGVYLVPVTIDP